MMLIVALVAWVAVSEASTGSLPADDMRSAHNSTTLIAAYSPSSSSNASMEMDKQADNYEERTGLELEDVGVMLGNFHASMFPKEQKAQIPELISRMTAHQTDGTGDGNIFEGLYFSRLQEFVSESLMYPETANMMMFKVLAHHFRHNHDALTMAIIRGTESDNTNIIAGKLLDVQINVWKDDNKDEARVFELLELNNGKPFESPLFLKWVAFLRLKYNDDEYVNKMLDVLAKRYKGDLIEILVAGTKISGTESFAEDLLDVQIQRWAKEKIPAEQFFIRSGLYQLNSNPFESPLFIKWFTFVKNQHNRSLEETYEMMLNILKIRYARENALVSGLVVGLETYPTFARGLLAVQKKVWVEKGTDAAEVFELLGLRQTNGNLFDSPAFSVWDGFLRSKYSDAAAAMMISTLKDAFKDDLDRLLDEATKSKRMKYVAKRFKALIGLKEGSPEPPKRRRDFDLNEPLAKKQRTETRPLLEIDLNEPLSPESI